MGCEREAAEGEKEGEAMDGNLKEVKTAEGKGKPGAHVQEVTPPPFPPPRDPTRELSCEGGFLLLFFTVPFACMGGEAEREKNE